MNIINKLQGAIRFQLNTIFRRNRIHFMGIKQYLGKNAHLRVSEKGDIRMGKKTYISDRSSIGAHNEGKILIGENNFFSSNVNIVCFKEIRIGNNNLFAQNIVIVDQSHNYKDRNIPICKQGYTTKEVLIGSDCWICANVVICPGTIIGDRVVVAANSVVKGNLDRPGVYSGSPAVLVKEI